MGSEDIPTVIDGFQVPTNDADIQGWYSEAADRVAMLDGDDMNSRASQAAHRELAAARQAMANAGIEPAVRTRRFGSR